MKVASPRHLAPVFFSENTCQSNSVTSFSVNRHFFFFWLLSRGGFRGRFQLPGFSSVYSEQTTFASDGNRQSITSPDDLSGKVLPDSRCFDDEHAHIKKKCFWITKCIKVQTGPCYVTSDVDGERQNRHLFSLPCRRLLLL